MSAPWVGLSHFDNVFFLQGEMPLICVTTSKVSSSAILWGKLHESTAFEQYIVSLWLQMSIFAIVVSTFY